VFLCDILLPSGVINDDDITIINTLPLILWQMDVLIVVLIIRTQYLCPCQSQIVSNYSGLFLWCADFSSHSWTNTP